MFNFSRENTSKLAKWWRNVDKQMFLSIIFLFLLGLFFSFSSTSQLVGEKLEKETYFFFFKHFIFVSISIIILIFISIQKNLDKLVVPFFIISFILLFLVPFIGIEVKGSKRWIELFFLPRFQPVEIIKPAFIFISAKIMISSKIKNKYFRYLITIIILFSIIFLLINQPDIGQTILITSSWLVMIFVSGVNIFFLIFIGVLSVFALGIIIYIFPTKFGYISSRIITFLNPSKGDNFQSEKALDAIKHGGFTGQGMGEGVLKDRVPEAHTDYIIAVISEEFGAFLVLFIVFVFLYIAYRAINKILYHNDEFVKLALIGLISLLIIQTFIHIGVNINLLPTTGMTMPFLSYGGSSLIGSAIIAGSILHLTKIIPQGFRENE
jgi:cell division protein FtsW